MISRLHELAKVGGEERALGGGAVESIDAWLRVLTTPIERQKGESS